MYVEGDRDMKRFVIGILKRLILSVAILVSIAAFGIVYGHLFGPSTIDYVGTLLLVAWPWALPELFVIVSIVWFFVKRVEATNCSRGNIR